MKYLILLFCLISSIHISKAQEIRHDIKIQLTGIPFGHFGFSYETILNESFSVNTSVNFSNKLPTIDLFESVAIENNNTYSDFSITPEIRYYLDPDYDCNGKFWGLYFRYKRASLKNTGDIFEIENNEGYKYASADHNVNHLVFGFNYGYKHVTDYGLFFEYLIGAGYSISHKIDFKNSESQEYWNNNNLSFIDLDFYHPSIDKFDFRFSISVGYRFNMD